MSDKKQQIEALRKRVEEVEAMLDPLRRERSALEQQIMDLLSQFKVGDVILWHKGNRMGRVVRVQSWVCDRPMWRVVRIRKDGSDGEECTVREYDGPVKA